MCRSFPPQHQTEYRLPLTDDYVFPCRGLQQFISDSDCKQQGLSDVVHLFHQAQRRETWLLIFGFSNFVACCYPGFDPNTQKCATKDTHILIPRRLSSPHLIFSLSFSC